MRTFTQPTKLSIVTEHVQTCINNGHNRSMYTHALFMNHIYIVHSDEARR